MFDLPGAYVRDLVQLVERWRVTPEVLLADLPISIDALRDPETRVPLRLCEAIVARAHALTHEPALAFYLGLQTRVSSHGFLGFAAMTSATVREALELAARFVSTRTSAIGLALYVEGDTASLVLEERTSLGPLREFLVIAIVVGIWQLGESLTGGPLAGHAEVAFTAPAYASTVPQPERIVFDRPAHRIVFAASTLERTLATADPVAAKLAIAQCERELSAVVDAGLPGRIRGLLASRAELPAVGALARELHMSERTLKRKLADHGTTYSAIRDDLRRQRALLLLDNRELSVGEIAGRLGYSELPNFTRAFRRWTGMTPAAYRGRANRAGAARRGR